jgi:hypothetical protein
MAALRMNEPDTPVWTADDLWLLRRLDTPRSFGGPTGICPPAIHPHDSRGFYRRRLLRLETHGLVWRAQHTHRNGETLWHRSKDGDAVVAAAPTT